MVPETQLNIPVRAKFYKVGNLQYISHLDLVRTMTRVLVRSHIPAWYSQGFNPRLKLTFSLPLSIGTQSECEFFDIRLTRQTDYENIKSRLNESLTDEMKITDVYTPVHKFSEIAWSEYEIVIHSPSLDASSAALMTDICTNPLVVMKRSKAGDHEVDISPFIKLRGCESKSGELRLRALMSADSANYLNPEYLIRAACPRLGVTFDNLFEDYYSIVRKQVYFDDLTPFC